MHVSGHATPCCCQAPLGTVLYLDIMIKCNKAQHAEPGELGCQQRTEDGYGSTRCTARQQRPCVGSEPPEAADSASRQEQLELSCFLLRSLDAWLPAAGSSWQHCALGHACAPAPELQLWGLRQAQGEVYLFGSCFVRDGAARGFRGWKGHGGRGGKGWHACGAWGSFDQAAPAATHHLCAGCALPAPHLPTPA